MILSVSTDTLISAIVLFVYCVAAFFFYKRTNTSIVQKVKDLAAASRKTKSPMMVIMHNKQEDRCVLTMIGDKYEIIKAITEATDTDEEAEEFMQIVSNFYKSKSVTR